MDTNQTTTLTPLETAKRKMMELGIFCQENNLPALLTIGKENQQQRHIAAYADMRGTLEQNRAIYESLGDMLRWREEKSEVEQTPTQQLAKLNMRMCAAINRRDEDEARAVFQESKTINVNECDWHVKRAFKVLTDVAFWML